MDREELLKEIKAYQAQFKEWDINFFQHEREKMNILNPYFGYKPVSPYEYNNGQGVRSLWMAGDSNRMVVEARPRGYSGDEIRFETDKMTERQLDGIRVLLKTLCEERRKDIERTQANHAARNRRLGPTLYTDSWQGFLRSPRQRPAAE